MTEFNLSDDEARLLHACLFTQLEGHSWRRVDTPEAWALERRLRYAFNHLPSIVARWKRYQEELEWHVQASEAARIRAGEGDAERRFVDLDAVDKKRWSP